MEIILKEFKLDNDYSRLALIATFPFIICVALVRLPKLPSILSLTLYLHLVLLTSNRRQPFVLVSVPLIHFH